MSDEMVQEKTDTTLHPVSGNGSSESLPGAAADAVVFSADAPPASANEPAPAQPVASLAANDATDSPMPSSTAAAENSATPAIEAPAERPTNTVEAPITDNAVSDAAEFESAMQSLDFDQQFKQSMRGLQEGDVITGTVMRVDREGVLVDVGAKSEGIIRLHELSREGNVNPNDVVKVGEKIKVYVLEPENQDGNPILSKKRADFEQAWEKVQQAKETGETLSAMVTDRVKGGLVVDLGIRGFVPASHVGNGSLKNNLDRYVGQSIPLKVIEVDKDKRKVVLSNKLAAAEERQARSQETKNSLAPGQIRHGMVRRLTNYGAFIDLGGIDGLLHISEMSWTRINDPKEILREGQELDVLILKMDLENERVSLGLRQILPDPWTDIPSRYTEGQDITGQITRVVPFGAFVQVEGGVEGIIPNAEMPRSRAGKPATPLTVGEEVTAKIISLRPEERKMTLSLRALQPPEERDAPQAPREVREPREPREGGAPRGDNAGGGREPGVAREAAPRSGRGGRGGRDRDEAEDYGRFTPREEAPRFTIGDRLGDLANAAVRREKPKRSRQPNPEEEEYDDLSDLDVDTNLEPALDATDEANAEAVAVEETQEEK